MARDQERAARAQQQVLVGGLPEVPGIGVAMRLTPGLGTHLRGLADEVLVNDYPGATLTRYEREFLANELAECRAQLELEDLTAVQEAVDRLEVSGQRIGEAIYAAADPSAQSPEGGA